MPTFRERLLDAEFQFLEALSDRQEIGTFKGFWSTLVLEIETAISENAIDEDTIAQYHSTARLIGGLSQCMLEFYEGVGAIGAAFRKDILAHLEGLETFSTSQPDVPSTRRDVSLAARWLSHNYHNPYPSNAVRDDISRQSDWNRKDVDAWFTEARKRIGWNEIRKRFFNNKRTEAVEKATQFFHGHCVSLSPVLAQAFVDMQSRVQDYYIDPFKPSKLAIALEKYPQQLPVTQKGNASPVPPPLSPISRSVSPVQMLRKRPRSDTQDEDDTGVAKDRLKRARGESVAVVPQLQLPSPAASQSDLTEKTPEVLPLELPDFNKGRSSSVTPLSNPKRRRRSFSETQGLPKYPSVAIRAAGLQAVSAPLPSPARSQRSASPRLHSPEAANTSDLHLSGTVSLSSQSSPLQAPLPSTETNMVHELPSEVESPPLSFDIPDPVTCDRPAANHTVDLTLFGQCDIRPCVPNGDHTSTPSALLGTMPEVAPPIGTVDLSSLSCLFDNSLSDDQLLSFLPLPFVQNAMTTPPAQADVLPNLSEVDIHLSPFFNLDASTSSQFPDSQLNELLFPTFLENSLPPPAPPTVDTDKAKQMAHLEMLKQQQNYLQERIKSLEEQISGRLPA